MQQKALAPVLPCKHMLKDLVEERSALCDAVSGVEGSHMSEVDGRLCCLRK